MYCPFYYLMLSIHFLLKYFTFHLVEEIHAASENLNILSTIDDKNKQLLSTLQDILNQVAIAFYGQETK